ncbi:unnamed protein product [Rhizoctonia solani]|uniref:Uncharacterized protein n=1 Tax=Rhizoctonia solani TaxID=456999 RepID=A0A8H2XQD1_9AGAM|nr:unnamed protein product [Rhizoctonia solani]
MSFSNPKVHATKGSFVNSNSFVIGSSNSLFASSGKSRTQKPHIINFTKEGNDWRKGETEAWYQEQKKLTTTFKSLEYRKERVYPFFHEFIVVDLGDETVCRFDRRGDMNSRANVLVGEPIPSEDTAHVISKNDEDGFYSNINKNSDLILRMKFPEGQDLLTILAICYGIQVNKNTQAYTLTRYNCYFFSWMIITATARCTVDWAVLAQEEKLWTTLVTSVIGGLNQDPGPGSKAIISTTSTAKNQRETVAPTQFVGSVYLVQILQKALDETREEIQKSLAELILHSTIDKAMHEVSESSAWKAASYAARNHASHAARDAAMEAVIETMWRDIISSTDGKDLWEKRCLRAEECVKESSAAAASVAGHRFTMLPPSIPGPHPEQSSATPANGEEVPAPPAKWETAWDVSWNKSWASPKNADADTSNDPDSLKNSISISERAKAAWIKAWEEACKANDVTYHKRSLRYFNSRLTQVTQVIKKMVKALNPIKGSSTSELQEWVKARILEHCQRVAFVTAGAQQPSTTEFEDTMKGVWASTVGCLSDIARHREITGSV